MGLKTGMALIGVAGIAVTAYALGGGGVRTTRVHGVAWRDSLADAQAEAQRTGKPILLLSMFGRLDETMPCANARTLRATLFKDPDFRKFVENEAIPAWEMVRPVPHVNIDFGNGKRIVRTVRGNAVMYLVNPKGKVFDAFPGVYTKDDFLPAARESIAQLTKGSESSVAPWHATKARSIPSTQMTVSKGVLESPTLNLIGAKPIRGFVTAVESTGSGARRDFIREAERLNDLSLRPMPIDTVIRTAVPDATNPQNLPEAVLKQDSEINMTRVRRVIHYYFASCKTPPTPLEARDAVLGTILKIPYKDPTMGLSSVLLPGTPE